MNSRLCPRWKSEANATLCFDVLIIISNMFWQDGHSKARYFEMVTSEFSSWKWRFVTRFVYDFPVILTPANAAI